MDAYAGPERVKNIANPLLHPILADIEDLPHNMMIVGGKVDILLHEQMTFVKRLEEEVNVIQRKAKTSVNVRGDPSHGEYHFQSEFCDNQIHGWLERMMSLLVVATDLQLIWSTLLVPSMVIDTKLRERIFDDAVHFLNNVYSGSKWVK